MSSPIPSQNTIGPALPKGVRAALARARKQERLRKQLRRFERALDFITLGATGAGKSAGRTAAKAIRGEAFSGAEAGSAALLAALAAIPIARGAVRGIRSAVGGGVRALRGDPAALRSPADVFTSGFRNKRRMEQFLREHPEVMSRLKDPTLYR